MSKFHSVVKLVHIFLSRIFASSNSLVEKNISIPFIIYLDFLQTGHSLS
jgi:hypothetical protein